MDYVNQTFVGQTVLLDGNTFRSCTFQDCTLKHEGGPFEIRDKFGVEGAVNFDLAGGEATVKLLDYVGRATGYINIGGRTYRLEE
jgi:hypothetical protein